MIKSRKEEKGKQAKGSKGLERIKGDVKAMNKREGMGRRKEETEDEESRTRGRRLRSEERK